MSSTENVNEQGREGELPGQQLTCELLLRLQDDIEGQGQRVAMALKPVAEALDNGGNVSHEMMNHLKAQILRAHLYLDDLKQLLDAIG